MVIELLKDCETCTQNTPQVNHPPLKPLVSTEPMEILMIDFFGPITPDPITGDRYKIYLRCLRIN
jgi:hypothetical protein